VQTKKVKKGISQQLKQDQASTASKLVGNGVWLDQFGNKKLPSEGINRIHQVPSTGLTPTGTSRFPQ